MSRVYFIGTIGGPIKIGVSTNLSGRLKTLQTGNPAKLQILGSLEGDISLERSLHRRFWDDRLGGEWFKPSPRLLSFVWQVAAGENPQVEIDTNEPPRLAGLTQVDPRQVANFLMGLGVSGRSAKRATGELLRAARGGSITN